MTTASPFTRLAVTHALSLGGDALLTMALAGSLFFSISPTAAKGRVALYLLLTMAPFAVVAPFLGPVLDRSRGGRRVVVVASMIGRALLCLIMARDLKTNWLFPEAFAFLVLSKSYLITKSALVPTTVIDQAELVEANSKLQLLGVVAGAVAAAPGAALLKTVGGAWVLRLGVVVFVGATAAALRIARAPKDAPQPPPEHREELRSGGIVLAASAMGLLRAAVGFLTFLVAFGFRHLHHTPSWWFGLVIAASMIGTLIGAAVAPWLRSGVREERILMASLLLVIVMGVVAARGADERVWASALAGVMGLAAAMGKLAFDSLVQRDAPDAARGRSFARFETRFQLLWVAGAILPVVLPIPMKAGFVLISAALACAAFMFAGGGRAVAHHRSHVRLALPPGPPPSSREYPAER